MMRYTDSNAHFTDDNAKALGDEGSGSKRSSMNLCTKLSEFQGCDAEVNAEQISRTARSSLNHCISRLNFCVWRRGRPSLKYLFSRKVDP